VVFLKPDEAAKRDRDFLSAELAERLKRGPVVFRLSVRLAGDGDPTHNTAVLWPADPPMIEAGRLEITGNGPTNTADERRLVFDPANLTDRIEFSDDKFPRDRSAGYSISYDRRCRGE
jgi:catalase